MLSLIAKDFKLLFQGNYKSQFGKVLSILFTIIVGAILIVIETFIFRAIFIKIKDVKDASIAYFSVFLFIISTLLTIFAVLISRKLFFNKEDNTKLQSLPISNFKLVTSKLFFLFITMYFINLVFNYPLFITYGLIHHEFVSFYFKALFYPVLLFFFQAGVALLLVYPYKLLSDFLDKHILVKVIIYLLIAIGLTLLYSRVLDIFINIVVNNNVSSLFTVKAMNDTINASKYMVPVNFLLEGFISKDVISLIIAIGLSLSIFVVGIILVTVFYHNFLQNVIYKKNRKEKEVQMKVVSPTKSLMKKEIILLFRNSSFLVSFITLLIIEPLISYLIIRSINTVFTKGPLSYYLLVVPAILPNLDITLMMLISLIIYQGVNNYISSENRGVRLMKSIPVSPFRQLLIKVGIPFILSASFLLVSYIALFTTNTLTIFTALYGLILNLILLFSISLVDLYEELNMKRNQNKNALLSTTYTYLVPILFLVTALLLGSTGMNYHIIYLLEIGLFSLTFVPFIIRLHSRVSNKFYHLEVVN